MKNSLKLWSSAVALACMAATTSDVMSANMTYFVNQGGIDNSLREIDFAAAFVPLGSGSTSGRKVWDLRLATNSGKAQCFEVSTSGNTNGNTRLWVGSHKLNDDANGTKYSSARVWLVPGTDYEYLTITVAAYSASFNTMKFSLNVKTFPTTMIQSQCVGTTGSAVKSIQGTRTYSRET